MTKLFNNKAQSAFKKLGAVAFITATLAICFTACNQTSGGNTDGGGGKPTPTPKHEVTFSVDGANGTLNAKAEGMATETEKSPITVEEGKTVTLTATANAGYNVKEWKVDGKPVADVGKSNTYIHTVKKSVTITVSFEAIPKHAITFNVEGENGTLKAMINGEEITSGTEIEEGKTVNFVAMPDSGYMVKEWKLDDKPIADAGKSNTYAHIVTKVATITVSFELTPKHAITFSVEGKNGTLTAKADGVPETQDSPITVEEGKAITFTSKADAGYGVKEWKVDDTAIQGNKENIYIHTVTKAVDVKVSFEIPSVEGGAVLILRPDKLNIRVKAKTADGSAITVEGCNEPTLVSGIETTLTATGTKVILKGEKITELGCSGNQLANLNVQGLTFLQELKCSRNELTELNVQGLTSLQKLRCANNKFIELNVQGLTSLQRLNCSDNKLTELNVQGLTSLQGIACSNNKLTDLNMQDLTSLQVLVCSYNQLTELNLQGLTALRVLDCYSNKLKAQAMTKILKTLPDREKINNAEAILYTGKIGEVEGNCKNFSTPELKAVLEGAKNRNWRLRYRDSSGKYKNM